MAAKDLITRLISTNPRVLVQGRWKDGLKAMIADQVWKSVKKIMIDNRTAGVIENAA